MKISISKSENLTKCVLESKDLLKCFVSLIISIINLRISIKKLIKHMQDQFEQIVLNLQQY